MEGDFWDHFSFCNARVIEKSSGRMMPITSIDPSLKKVEREHVHKILNKNNDCKYFKKKMFAKGDVVCKNCKNWFKYGGPTD